MGKKTPLCKTVKDTVDLVFELTTSNPDGYDIKTEEFGFAGSLVIKILVQRGILERTRVKVAGGRYRYKWVVASAPTKVLYGSITQEISDFYKAKNAKYPPKKKSAEKATVDVIAEEPIPAPAVVTVHDGPVPAVQSLDPFSAQELWDELKRRGFFIEGERLCIVKKAYLD